MNTIRIYLILLFTISGATANARNISITSPDRNIVIDVNNSKRLTYSVTYKGRDIVNPSKLGFELKAEDPMSGNFDIMDCSLNNFNETWIPVVKSKHAEILNNYNELQLILKERSGAIRQMEFIVRAYNDGIAFRYKLSRSAKIGDRQIVKELTTFNIPGDPRAWIVEYKGYSSSNEAEFFEHPLSYLNEKSVAGMPLLMEYGNNCWVAITEAMIDNYAAFYIGTNGVKNQLTTRLVPLPGEPESGVKVRFNDEVYTPWRVLMIGETPGALIESEIVQNLNDPCVLEDPSWIKPGMSAWDHPDNILNQAGADFLKLVPTVWDDIRFIGGYPGDYVAIAKRSGDSWFIGVMNNSIAKSIDLKLDFLPAGKYETEIWADARNSDTDPKALKKVKQPAESGSIIKVTMSKNGGFVALIKRK